MAGNVPSPNDKNRSGRGTVRLVLWPTLLLFIGLFVLFLAERMFNKELHQRLLDGVAALLLIAGLVGHAGRRSAAQSAPERKAYGILSLSGLAMLLGVGLYLLFSAKSVGIAEPLHYTLEQMLHANIPLAFFAPFLTNHDQRRLATELGSDPQMLRLAASVLLAMPGTPFLYYGEEIGLGQSSSPGDRGQRAPMPWATVEAQRGQPDSLLSYYRRLIQLRRQTPALREAAVRRLFPQVANEHLLALSRGTAGSGKAPVIAVYNLGSETLSGVQLGLPADYPLGAQRDLLGNRAGDAGGRAPEIIIAVSDFAICAEVKLRLLADDVEQAGRGVAADGTGGRRGVGGRSNPRAGASADFVGCADLDVGR